MIAGIVLAAGSGTRMGLPKALLRTDRENESFLRRACRILREAGADTVVAVVSADVRTEVRELPSGVVIRINDDPARGQLSSLQVALAALDEAHVECEAAVVLPVDVPLVRAETIASLIDVWRRVHPAVVRPSREGRHGHPVVFDRSVFAELAAAEPGSTAKAIVRAHSSDAGDLPADDDGAFTDVDTVEDYVRAFRRLPERAALR